MRNTMRFISMRFIMMLLIGVVIASPAQAIVVQEVTAPKTGVKAWLVENHKNPVVSLHVSFKGGSEQDPVAKQGLANLTMALLTQGAGRWSAEAFQSELANQSISMGFSAGRDELGGEMRFLSADKDKAFDLLAAALAKPRFESDDVERLRNQQLAALRQQVSDPGWQGRFALYSEIYAGHPYGQRYLGSTQSLKSITVADIKAFAAAHVARDNAIVAVAGDMTPADLAAALDKAFADVHAHAKLAAIAEAPEVPEKLALLVPREGTQTDMLFVLPGIKRDDPDWYAAQIANYILGGGGFSSRLMQEVRDKKGLTYGIQTGMAASDHGGLIVGQAAVANGKAAEAWQTIIETMHEFYSDGATDKEIAAAKEYLTGSMPLSLTSTGRIAGVLVAMQREGLGRDYLDRYDRLIRSVKPSQVSSVIDRLFDPDKGAVVFVGKPEGMQAKLPGLKSKPMVRQ